MMNKQQILLIFSLLTSLTVFTTVTYAMSSAPETTPVTDPDYYPADWQTSTSAYDDAEYAVVNNDLRFVGFATRGYTLPGVDADKKQRYIDRCGIRILTEFGDVVRDASQLRLMKRAQIYAEEYNTVILESCTFDNQ